MSLSVDVNPGKTGTSATTSSSIFSTCVRPFPEPADGKIDTLRFLDGANGVVSLVEQLGKAFAPVKYDMRGNIVKITNKYNENPVKYEFLNNILVCEQAEGGVKATDALLWLRRALHFFHDFLLSIVEDTKADVRPESLTGNIQKAYKGTLESYHGFLAQRLFNVLSKLVPRRADLLKAFARGEVEPEELFLEELERFLVNLNSNLTAIVQIYQDLKLVT